MRNHDRSRVTKLNYARYASGCLLKTRDGERQRPRYARVTACVRVHVSIRVRVYACACADDNLYIRYLKSKNILYLLHTVEPAMPDQRIGSPSVSPIFSNLNREMHAKSHEIRTAETNSRLSGPDSRLFSKLICLQSDRSRWSITIFGELANEANRDAILSRRRLNRRSILRVEAFLTILHSRSWRRRTSRRRVSNWIVF